MLLLLKRSSLRPWFQRSMKLSAQCCCSLTGTGQGSPGTWGCSSSGRGCASACSDPCTFPEPERGPASCSSHRAHFPSLLGLTAVESAAPKSLGSGENQLSCPWLIEDWERSTGSANSSCCWCPPVHGNPQGWLLWRKGRGLFWFCGDWADQRAWCFVSGAADTGEQQARGEGLKEGQGQTSPSQWHK